eukprot:7377057-Prymnesium_polylepis.2
MVITVVGIIRQHHERVSAKAGEVQGRKHLQMLAREHCCPDLSHCHVATVYCTAKVERRDRSGVAQERNDSMPPKYMEVVAKECKAHQIRLRAEAAELEVVQATGAHDVTEHIPQHFHALPFHREFNKVQCQLRQLCVAAELLTEKCLDVRAVRHMAAQVERVRNGLRSILKGVAEMLGIYNGASYFLEMAQSGRP